MAHFDLQMRDWFRAACIKRRITFKEGVRLLAQDVGEGPVLALKDHRGEGGGSGKDRFPSDEEGEQDGRSDDGPLALTAAEEQRLRLQGRNPKLIARMHEVKNINDYRRIKREVELGGAA